MFITCTQLLNGDSFTSGTGNRNFLYFFSAQQSESKLSLYSLIEKASLRSFALSLMVKDCLSALLHFIGFLYIATWKHNSVVLIPIFHNTSL